MLDKLTLTTVNEGALVDDFGDLVDQVVRAFTDDAELYKPPKLKARITLTVDFELDLETHVIVVRHDASLKGPTRRKTAGFARLRLGELFVDPVEDPRQITLEDGIREAKSTPRIVADEEKSA